MNHLYDSDGLHQFLRELKDDLCEIKKSTKITNGRVSKLERYMIIGAAVVLTLLVTNGSQLASFLMGII